MAGFAIDFQVVTTKKNKAQLSLDSSLIAGSRAMQSGGSDQDVIDMIKLYFASATDINTYNHTCSEPVVTISKTSIAAEATCVQETTLGALAGIEEVTYKIYSGSTYGVGKIDVVFVFDVSGSMIGARMDALKDAAAIAVDQLLQDDGPPADEESDEADVRISMVSYNNSLNAGSLFEAATGLESSRSHSYYHYYYRRWFNIPYTSNCVYERRGDEAFTDAAPDQDVEAAPNDNANPGDYITAVDYWDRNECRDSSVQTLTTDEDTLLEYIEDLDPSGGTAGHLGVSWAWYMVSPEWADILPVAPRPYDEEDSAKAIVLMTDGDFNSEHHWQLGSSRSQAEELCDNIKATGIRIYSVAFQAPASGEAVLDYCSSGPEYFFDPSSGEELEQAYVAIASSISDLRLTR